MGGRDAVGSSRDTIYDRLDKAFTHPIIGLAVFVAVMGGLFWTIFSLAGIPMDLIDVLFEKFGGLAAAVIPEGAIRDLAVDGIIGGIAGTVVFLPQILILFFLLALLEDTGYLARAAFVMDRVMCRFGLPGQAFVPMLSSHACALPGIMSARLVPDRDDRLATILVAPFMSCTARLPVYVLLIGLLFDGSPWLAGFAFAGCYLLGAAAALLSALLARRTILPGRSRPMVLELPEYRRPSIIAALLVSWDRGLVFIKNAGTVILGIVIVMWWLSAYPKADTPDAAIALRTEAAEVDRPRTPVGRRGTGGPGGADRARMPSRRARSPGGSATLRAAVVRTARRGPDADRGHPHEFPRPRGVRLEPGGAAGRRFDDVDDEESVLHAGAGRPPPRRKS